jgi:hypothetical protein
MDEQQAKRHPHEDYHAVFTSEMGQRVLRDLMDRFHMWGSIVPVGQPMTGNELAFAEGHRAVVLHILNQCDLAEKFRREPHLLQEQMRKTDEDYRTIVEEPKHGGD